MPTPLRPHALYVAWGFPPGRSGGVYRALATANALVEQGFRVTVLTVDRDVFERFTGVDESLEEQLDTRVRVVRIPFAWPVRETDPARFGRFRRTMPRVWRRLRLLADQVPFPEVVYGPWRRPLERAARQIHAADPVDVVLATANPNVDFTAARVLSRRHDIPYVMDYRDAWLLDVFDGRQTHSDRSRPARIEADLVGSALEVWFVNEPIRQWHADRYPASAGRMHVVANGFDPQFAPAPATTPRPPGPVRFGYIGTVSPKVPLLPFVAGWRRAREQDPRMRGATTRIWGYLGFYATPDPRLQELLSAQADVGLSYAGPLAKGAVRSVYADLDVLLLILGTGRYVTSGKVFEYLASGLPVVSVHDPGNAASSVLEGYPLWFPCRDLSAEAVADALGEAAGAALAADPDLRQACVDFAAQYARDVQLLPRITAVADAVG